MNHDYNRKAPLIRFVFVAAALSMTLSVGLFIDLLTTANTAYASQEAQSPQMHPVMTASR